MSWFLKRRKRLILAILCLLALVFSFTPLWCVSIVILSGFVLLFLNRQVLGGTNKMASFSAKREIKRYRTLVIGDFCPIGTLSAYVENWNETQTRINYTHLPLNLQKHKNKKSFTDRFKIVAGNLPYSQTIVAHICKDGHYFIHPDINQNRSLTPREAARLQTFPDDYYFESKTGKPSRTTAFKQIGKGASR